MNRMTFSAPTGWCDPVRIEHDPIAVRGEALAIFGHHGKIDAILQIVGTARRLGARRLRNVLVEPEPFRWGPLIFAIVPSFVHTRANCLSVDAAVSRW